MVTYNQERYIAQAIESVLAQETTFPVEIVIGEDCSTDNTRAIVEGYARRHSNQFRLLLNERNLGGKPNFMRTFSECRGNYVAILEGDDYWTCPHKLQRQVDALESRPDWAMCFHPARIVYEGASKPPVLWPENWEKPEATLVDLFEKDFIPTNAVVFRNRLFGQFPSWFADLLIGDWVIHMLNAEHGNIGFLPEIMSVYRVHAGGIWSGMDHGSQMFELLKMLCAVDHHFAGKYAQPIDQCRANILRFLIDEAKQVKQDNARLVEENLALKESVQAFHRSVLFKVAREIKRPWIQLRGQLLKLRPATDNWQPTGDETKPKAA